MIMEPKVLSSAVISECRRYRYELWRTWDTHKGYVLFIGLNPSTADATVDDPTIRRCVGFARKWGYGALAMANLFAWRATDPKELYVADDPVGPENHVAIHGLIQNAGMVIAAWGTHGSYRNRDEEVRAMIPRFNCERKLFCLGVNKNGSPKHPLYVKSSRMPYLYFPLED